jgi:hypothetical protein
VYSIPVPHEGINSITPDESRGVAYVSTSSDGRPGPGGNAHFLILDLKTGTCRNRACRRPGGDPRLVSVAARGGEQLPSARGGAAADLDD